MKFNLPEELMVEIATKRFEYTFESMWKAVKEFLRLRGLECNSPRSCFSELLREGTVSYSFEKTLFKMIKIRNLLVHVYDEKQAKEIYSQIGEKDILDAFKEVLRGLKKG